MVVGVDGSASSVDALRQSRHLVEVSDADVVAICTWQTFAGYGRYHLPADVPPHIDAEDRLRATVHEAFGDTVPPRLSTQAMRGAPARTLIEAARGARMLVVGRRGPTGAPLQRPGVHAVALHDAHEPPCRRQVFRRVT